MIMQDLIRNSDGNPPERRLIILGVNPIIEELTDNPQFFYDLLNVQENLNITVIYESETENFNQSLFFEEGVSRKKIDFDKLQTYRNRLIGGSRGKGKHIAGFAEDVLSGFGEAIAQNRSRITLFQNNLRHFVNLIIVDDVILYSFTTLDLPTLDMYQRITADSNPILYKQFDSLVSFLLNEKVGGVYLSKPGDELIELYDNNSFPRGIYPRKAFYSTEYQRYSIWAFVFNRHGELLLHKRSDLTQDNRSLWDKSAGGHVDLRDSSTIITAKRELVEEMFLPEAEFTKYMQAELGDIIDFGEWNINKRAEKYYLSSFDGLDDSDWIVFRATDTNEKGDYVPMTIRRKSPRIMHVKDLDEYGKQIPLSDESGSPITDSKGNIQYKEHTETWYTRFMSDVFLFIAPKNYLDTNDQMMELLQASEKSGASSAHRLITVDDLIKEVNEYPENFTDDVVFMCSEKKWLLLQFAESVRYIFK
jgi:hypothetical protein